MQDLLTNFGIQPVLLAAQIVNFLIIFWLLKKFAFKPIFQVLERRKKLIAEGVENAQESGEVLQKALDKEKEVLKDAQNQAQEILSDAQKQSLQILSQAEDTAKVRVEKILLDAKKEIEQQTLIAEEQLSRHTAGLAVDLLKKSLVDVLDSKTQKEAVEKVAKKLKKEL